mmetsp:Transcript_440/g.1615  ORF Transcript_440/g.1615 Transcript_440/m.1615 type:complete len:214 (-) Transcript_440:202-843(-)
MCSCSTGRGSPRRSSTRRNSMMVSPPHSAPSKWRHTPATQNPSAWPDAFFSRALARSSRMFVSSLVASSRDSSASATPKQSSNCLLNRSSEGRPTPHCRRHRVTTASSRRSSSLAQTASSSAKAPATSSADLRPATTSMWRAGSKAARNSRGPMALAPPLTAAQTLAMCLSRRSDSDPNNPDMNSCRFTLPESSVSSARWSARSSCIPRNRPT